VERRGRVIRGMTDLVNWQQEEPIGCGGGRQLSMDGTSRVSREAQARFCERLGVQLPGATRRYEQSFNLYSDSLSLDLMGSHSSSRDKDLARSIILNAGSGTRINLPIIPTR
jgi:hypothetical protein